MLDAHQVEDCRVEVVYMHAVLDDIVAEVVGLAEGRALVDARSGHQDREAARVVVTAVVSLGEGALRVGRTTELAAPDDERIVEQATLFEVGEQAGRGLVGIITLTLDGPGQSAVVIPAHVEKLDEAYVAFAEAAGEEAIGSVGTRALHIRTIEVEDVLRFLRQVKQVRHARLHAEGHLILRDARLDLGVA
jgi:hypothetical protein